MATSICKSINSLFSIEPNNEEKNVIESFIRDSDKLTLNVTRNKDLMRLIFETNTEIVDENHHQYNNKDEVIVFVKMKSIKEDEADEIFDQSDKIAQLSALISECTADQSSIMNTLSELRKYYKLEKIMNSLKPQREVLLEKIIKWSENSYDNIDYYENYEEEGKDEKESNSTSAVKMISSLKAKESKLKAVMRICDVLFNDINGYQETKSKVFKHEIKEIIEEYNTLFRRWCKTWDTINLDTSKSCIEIDHITQIPFVTFDRRLVKLSQQCRTLSALGFILPEHIIKSKNNIRKYSLIARELREIVNFYCTIGEKILLSQRPMLIDAAKVFTQLLEAKNSIKWDQEPGTIRLWLDELKEFSKKFSTENKLLRKKHDCILKLILELFEIVPSKWKSQINEIQSIFHVVDGKYANTLTWKIHWDYQLYKILEYHFNVAIIKCNEWLGFIKSSLDSDQSHNNTLRIELSFIRSQVSFQPTLEEIQSKIYQRIKKFLNVPVSFEGFVSSSSASNKAYSSIFKTIYLRNFTAFSILYDEANKIITELREIENTFKQWTSLYSIVANYTNTPTQLNSILKLDCLDDYKNNLIMIKAKAQDFNKIYINSEILCKTANIQINIAPIKLFIEWIYMEMDKLLVLCLKYESESKIKQLHQLLDDTLIKLTTNPKNILTLNELELFMQNELNTLCNNVNIKYNELENRINFLNKWSSHFAPNLNELSSRYDELQGIYENKDNLLLSYKNQLKSKIESTINTFTEEVETLLLKSKSLALLQERFNNSDIDDDYNSVNNNNNNNTDIHEIYLRLMSLEEDKIQIIDGCNYFHINHPIVIEKFDQLTAKIYEMDSKLNLMNEFENGLQIYKELEWIVCRHKLTDIENYINHWEDENANMTSIMKRKLKEWRDFINLLKSCRGECFLPSHWLEFFNILNLDKSINYETLKFHHLIEKKEKILTNKDLIKELNSRAIGGSFIIDTFNELDTFARETSFDLYVYKCDNGKELKLVKNWRFILDKIAEAIFTLNLIKSSEYFTNEFEEKGSKWENQLYLLDSLVNTLNLVQRKWTYLEPIYFKNFNQENFDQTNHLHDSIFSQDVDTIFSNIINTITKDPHIMNLLRIPQLQSKLNNIDSHLTLRQKKLTYFMEKSRNRFPRFYFLADDDLLLVLAGKVSINESNLLKKLFNNTIIKIHINDDEVNAIESPEGEIIKLNQLVKICSKEATEIENWLKQLESSIQQSLKKSLFKLIKSDNDYDNNDYWSSPSQIISLYQWIKFTIKVEEAIKFNRLAAVKNEYIEKLAYLTSVNTNDVIHKIKIKSLILDTIHFLSVIEELIELSIDDIDDWQWKKQLRYYVVEEKDQKVKISMGLGFTYYSFEYIGCYGSSKLVHTPLTDKCYLVCMQAISLGLGGNPYGPAGTGKTETIKALGQQLGRSVLVFNCDEAIDIKAMTRILIGIIQCGAWGCFDEFNRLQVDVLSSLSSHIQSIQNSLRNNLSKVTLDSNEIVLNHYSGIFVTLNPAGKQYKGRNELPDNLKTLFLPIAMTIPDSSMISRVILLSEGFELEKSKELGEKITLWFHLAKDCMSTQKHYDWGLRAIKSCLSSSGNNLRLLADAKNKKSIDEISFVVRSLRTQIKSKLICEDEKHFDDLIIDVFGNNYSNENSNENSNEQLRSQIVQVFTENNLIPLEDQIKKVIELDEQLNSRLGVALIGDTGTGKSTIWHALIKLRKLQGIIVTPVVINPKSMSRKQLLGFIDEETREWHDGVLTLKSRSISRDNSNSFYLIVFDGYIDPEWVESLNSVLDDNRILTLPSGERIDFNQSKVNILFETTNLCFASPATISRLGIISASTSKVMPYLMSHLKDMSYSVDDIFNIISNNKKENIISKARTAIVLFKKLATNTNTKLEIDNMLDYLNTSSVVLFNQCESYKLGEFIVTSTSKRIISLINILNDYDSHILLIGNKGIGKHTLLCETIFKTGKLISIDCNPGTLPEEVIKLLKTECITMNTGSSISLKSNDKIIIYIRNLELLEEDKWRSIKLIEFLFTLITYHGFYDANCQWIHLDNFQIIATSITSEFIDTRFISLFHTVTMDISNINELEIILKLRITNNNGENCGWCNTFPNKYISICQDLMKKYPNVSISIIKNGFKIINILERYNEITNDALWLETFRSLQEYLPDSDDYLESLKKKCDDIFGQKDKQFVSLVSKYGSMIMMYNFEEACEFFRKSITNWKVNNEILSPQIALIDETINLFAELSIFLSSLPSTSSAITENNGLILLGSSGSGRKIATRVMANVFNYENIWSPGINCTEKQLIQELQALTSIDREDQKTILLIDQEHLYLLKFLITNLISFTKNARKYPVKIVLVMNNLSDIHYSILSRTYNIYRVEKWSDNSLLKIPQLIINDLDENILNGFSKILKKFPDIYKTCRRFLSFVTTFALLYKNKIQEIENKRNHLNAGVSKLEEVSREVIKLKKDAEQQQEILASKRLEADTALDLITTSMHSSEDQKVELEDIKKKTEKESSKLAIRKKEIEKDLKDIEPILQAAKTAVGGIKSESLSEIRSLRAPPETIRHILEGVLRLMGVNDTSWVSMKSFLSRRGVKEEIINFDSRKITPEMRIKVENLLNTKAESFDEKYSKRASVAAAPLANWVKANISYSKVLHKIKPLEDEQKQLEDSLRSAELRMKSLTKELTGVELEVGSLRNKLNQVTVEAAEIEINLKQTKDTLNRSEILIEELSNEYERWRNQLNECNIISETCGINCLIIALYVHLAGRLSSNEERHDLLNKCFDLFDIKKFNLCQFLKMQTEEELFVKVPIHLLTRLYIDPSQKLLKYYKDYDVLNIKQDKNRILELNLRFGKTTIIQEIDKLDLILLPLMRKLIYGNDGSRNWIYLGEKRIDYNPQFELIIFINEPIDVLMNSSLVNVINLMPNSSNTINELLSIIISNRRSELEEKKLNLDKNKYILEEKLNNLEDQLLEKLSTSSGNLLNNYQLIDSLKEIKRSFKGIQFSLNESLTIENDINHEREQYSELAITASKLLFYIQELSQLNNMYKFGIREYHNLFIDSLKSHNSLTSSKLILIIYEYVSKGLYTEDAEAFKRFLISQLSENSNFLSTTSDSNSNRGGNSLKVFLNTYLKSGNILLIITSPGSDPIAEILSSLSTSANDINILSMASDIIEKAESLIEKKLPIICLTNLHLVIDWCAKLTNLLIANNNTSYILVTQAHHNFPSSLLKISIKYIYYSSVDLRSTINNLINNSNNNNSSYNDNEIRQLNYFHSICCERCNYVPFGWSKEYDFGYSNYQLSLNIIDMIRLSLRKGRHKQLQYIKHILADIIYGGKLDNKVDENILNVLIKDWFSEFNHNNHYNKYINNYINLDNMHEELSLLGLSSNANKRKIKLFEEKITKSLHLLKKATNIQLKNEEINNLNRILTKRIQFNYNDESSNTIQSPLKSLILSECSFINHLINIIISDLNTSKSYIINSYLNRNETPETWLNIYESGSKKPSIFIENLIKIENYLISNLNNMNIDIISINKFIHPSSLLNLLRQIASRTLGISIDTIKYYCSWGKSLSSSVLSDKYYLAKIDGIFIEGALFNGILTDCNSDTDIQSNLPILHLYFVAQDQLSPYETEFISLPVYDSSSRERLITWLDMPCKSGSSDHWIKAGVAIIINFIGD